MGFAIGALLLLLGLVALWAWWAAVLIFLKGLVVLVLIVWGLLTLITALAKWKAKRQLARALADQPSELESRAEAEAPSPPDLTSVPDASRG